jgi:hypothetical protein
MKGDDRVASAHRGLGLLGLIHGGGVNPAERVQRRVVLLDAAEEVLHHLDR